MKNYRFMAISAIVMISAGFAMPCFAAPKDVNPFTTQLEGGVAGALPPEYVTQESRSPILLVNRIIRIALSFLGIGTIALMVYAGAKWMMSRGNEDEVSKAKRTLRNAVIGLIIIMMAYTLSLFITMRLQRATGSYVPTFEFRL